MKKESVRLVSIMLIIGIAIFLSLSLVSASWFGDAWNKITGKTVTGSSCTETDSGIDYNVRGITTGTYSNGQVVTYNDYCFAASSPFYYAQVTSGKGLKEFYCQASGYVEEVNYENCANGCENGACKSNVATCTPTSCSSLGKTCGSYSDGCSGSLNCGTCNSGSYCSSGNCVVNNTVCTPSTCASLGKTCGSYSDGCSGSLNCGTCNSGSYCSSGNCVVNNTAPVPIGTVTCNSNNNCPTSVTSNRFCENNRVCMNNTSSQCMNPSTVQSYCNTTTVKNCGETCTNGCSNGACIVITSPVICKSWGCNLTTSRPNGIFTANNINYSINLVTVSSGSATLDVAKVGESVQRGGVTTNRAATIGPLSISARNIFTAVVIGQDFRVDLSKIELANQSTFPITCTDSDGGLNYNVKGMISASDWGTTYDSCFGQDSNNLIENYCENNSAKNIQYACPYGCSDGACNQYSNNWNWECGNLDYRITGNVQSFQDSLGNVYNLDSTNNESWIFYDYKSDNPDVPDVENPVYSRVSWWNSDNGNNHYLFRYVKHSFQKNSASDNFIEQLLEEKDLCIADDWDGNVVYICSYFDKELYEDESRIIWKSENSVYELDSYYSNSKYPLSQQERLMQDISEFSEDLKNNNYKWANVQVPYAIQELIKNDLKNCSSELTMTQNEEGENCTSNWICKIEPVVCPPHGYQTRTCTDNNCDQPDREEQLSCSPGVCSGCYSPKWIGSSDNTCIPYGFRFAKQAQDEDTDRAIEGETSDYLLRVISSTQATIVFKFENEISNVYNLVKGEEVKVILPSWSDVSAFTIKVDDVYFVSEGSPDNYIDITATVEKAFDAYCDIDGQVKLQKSKDSNGDWAKCQNNYECFSNVCSGGECIDVQGLFEQASGFKSLGVRILCNLASFFGIEEYNSCVASYLG